MTPRERVVRTLTFQPVDRPPRQLWTVPGIHIEQPDAYAAFLKQYPSDMVGPVGGYARAKRARGVMGEASYTDAWGCEFQVLERGIVGEVKKPLFGEGYDDLDAYEAPYEILEGVDLGAIALGCAETDHFVLTGTETRPFERLQFLRGTENVFIDLAMEEPGLFVLLDKLHAFFVQEMRLWASSAVDGVSFMDDWGTQISLLISPAMWRRIFKPLYKEYVDILHAAGKFAFFHSDGFIEDIFPDLVEIGIDAINSQLFCMDIEKLGAEYAGKVAFWGELDRQGVLHFGTGEEVRRDVNRYVRALCPQGQKTGIFAQCSWSLGDPMSNFFDAFDEWDQCFRRGCDLT